MVRFEVGHEYEASDPGIGSIEVLRRTEKTIFVTNKVNEWRMRVKVEDGIEYVADSSVPKRWREAYIYKASWEV